MQVTEKNLNRISFRKTVIEVKSNQTLRALPRHS